MSRIINADMPDSALKPFSMSDISDERSLPEKWSPEHLFERSRFKDSTDMWKDSGELQEKGKEEADRYIKEAKKRASDIEREAYKKAFAQGERAGIEIGKKKAESEINRFYKTVEELSGFRERIYEGCENELVKLALVISRSIIHQELTLNKEVILSIVKAILKNAIGAGEIKIRVSPLDIEFIRQSRPQILNSIDGLKNIILEEDRSIIRGGCIVETDFGDIDARIEKQIEELDRALRSSMRDMNV